MEECVRQASRSPVRFAVRFSLLWSLLFHCVNNNNIQPNANFNIISHPFVPYYMSASPWNGRGSVVALSPRGALYGL